MGARDRMRVGWGRRLTAEVSAVLLGGIVYATDLLPPRLRYGYVHRITRRLLQRQLPTVGAAFGASPVTETPRAASPPDLTCVLAADRLDIGGIGSVVEMLAVRLGAARVRPVVVCHGDGARAERLRSQGIEVHSVHDTATARAAIEASGADVVQLHSAPAYLEDAAMASGRPLVPVLHNTEIHFTRAKWAALAGLLDRSAACIAVSDTVREFHIRQLSALGADHTGSAVEKLSRLIEVVPNGAPDRPAPTADERRRARSLLESAIGVSLADSVVFVCLARYDAQKNIAGMVASFLRATAVTPHRAHLVMAGEPSDWVELRRADALRRADRMADCVHLLANSDAGTLLSAADAFLLDSFFEGWPVAATEAAAAGLPLLLSEVGGAKELVARDPGRSWMVPNPSGAASEVSDARVRTARRRARHQPNTEALTEAMVAISARVVDHWGEGTAPAARTISAMLTAHADILRDVTTRS